MQTDDICIHFDKSVIQLKKYVFPKKRKNYVKIKQFDEATKISMKCKNNNEKAKIIEKSVN